MQLPVSAGCFLPAVGSPEHRASNKSSRSKHKGAGSKSTRTKHTGKRLQQAKGGKQAVMKNHAQMQAAGREEASTRAKQQVKEEKAQGASVLTWVNHCGTVRWCTGTADRRRVKPKAARAFSRSLSAFFLRRRAPLSVTPLSSTALPAASPATSSTARAPAEHSSRIKHRLAVQRW